MCTATYLETTCYVCKKSMGPQVHREHVLSKIKPDRLEVSIGHVLRLDDRPAVEECTDCAPHELRPAMGWQTRLDRCANCIPVEDGVAPRSVERGELVIWVQSGWLVMREKPTHATLSGYVEGLVGPGGCSNRMLRSMRRSVVDL